MSLSEWLKSRSLTIPNASENIEQKELSFTADGIAKRYSYFGRQIGGFLQNETYSYLESSSHASWYLSKGAENMSTQKPIH